MTALQIPDATAAAFTATYEAAQGDHSGIAYSFGMASAAPLIVAAELRRLADELRGEGNAHRMWDAIDQRANQLDPRVTPTRHRRLP